MRIRVLRDIPNHAGFKFTGIDELGNHFDCEVRKGDDGHHFVVDGDGDHCFHVMVGWITNDEQERFFPSVRCPPSRRKVVNLTGKRVETCVYVAGERIPMREGVVTRDDDSGVCEVDIGSLHGCAPWRVLENKSGLRVVDTADR